MRSHGVYYPEIQGNAMDIAGVRIWTENWFRERIDPEQYCYHNLAHTAYVAREVELFCRDAGSAGSELTLFQTAAWLHDIGYGVDSDRHEAEGARIAMNILPEFGYSADESAMVAKLILATELNRIPVDSDEALIRDADFGHFGTDSFEHFVNLFRQEMSWKGAKWDDAAFWLYEDEFLKNFRYYSEAACCLRNAGLELNRCLVRHKLTCLAGDNAI